MGGFKNIVICDLKNTNVNDFICKKNPVIIKIKNYNQSRAVKFPIKVLRSNAQHRSKLL